MGRLNLNLILDDEETRKSDSHYVYRRPFHRDGEPVVGPIYVPRADVGRMPPWTLTVQLEWTEPDI